jgi:hypothetical protein
MVNNQVELTEKKLYFNLPIWIDGNSLCGKTTYLVEIFTHWSNKNNNQKPKINQHNLGKFALIFCANNRGKVIIENQILTNIANPYPYQIKTPFGFMIDEVNLFFPLILATLQLNSPFPLRLRPETEQELATKLWHSQLNPEIVALFGGEYHFVRRCLDLMQLAGCGGIPVEEITYRLQIGFPDRLPLELAELIGNLIQKWRKWCLDRSLLSYGLTYELYWRYLLPNTTYQTHLLNRYSAIFADDVDDYPAISADILRFFLKQEVFGAFTYSNHGKIRLGLSADPDYLAQLAHHCQCTSLTFSPIINVATKVKTQVLDLLEQNIYVSEICPEMRSLRTRSRPELLNQVTDLIINKIESGKIEPAEIAIVAPGLDEITRYTLIDKLSQYGIEVQPLQEQRPLISSPVIRALLTLLGLLFQGLGRLVERDSVAEMLVILSQCYQDSNSTYPPIDPVRAGLLADHCYHIDLELPSLLSGENLPRWDRLSYSSLQAYNQIRAWIEDSKLKIKQNNYPPLAVIEQAISYFFPCPQHLTYIQLSNLREFKETAHHFWQVQKRLQLDPSHPNLSSKTVADFIILLRKGTITANPYPFDLLTENNPKNSSLIISNIYQYRSFRGSHRWQFWLDVGSNLWSKGGSAELFAAPLFLQSWQNQSFTPEQQIKLEEERLLRIVQDLLARATEKVVLCHSYLAVNGTEQINSPLLSLCNFSLPV